MILELAARGKKTFAAVMLALLYIETVLPMNAVAAVRGGFPAKAMVPVPEKTGAILKPEEIYVNPNKENMQALSAGKEANIYALPVGPQAGMYVLPAGMQAAIHTMPAGPQGAILAQPAGAQATIPAHPQPDDIGGPGQPETQAFTSVNGDNLVDLF